MEIKNSILESKYSFATSFLNDNNKEVNVAVLLTIYHDKKKFSIIPCYANTNSDSFVFKAGDETTSLIWYYVAELIKNATTFASKELGFNN